MEIIVGVKITVGTERCGGFLRFPGPAKHFTEIGGRVQKGRHEEIDWVRIPQDPPGEFPAEG